MNSLEKLFLTISEKVKNNNKLEELDDLLKSYNGKDWEDYVKFSDIKYTRNNVFSDENIEMIVICWNNKQQSGIHDHPNNGCLMKILQGEITEECYNNKLELIKINNNKVNDIGYQEGNNGIHNIINSNNKSISLHIYSPPNYKSNFF